MSWLSRILAPVDFTPACRGAAQYAETLADHFHGELMLLHVVPPPIGPFTSPEAAAYSTAVCEIEDRMEHGQAELDRFVPADCPGLSVSDDVIMGQPAREILGYAQVHKADLIVMATHGYGPWRRLWQGSVTAQVQQNAPCPVWSGSHLESAPAYREIRFRRILCALDLGARSRQVLAWAAQFAREFGAQLSVLHMLPHTVVETGGIYFDPVWRQDAISAARAEIRELQRSTDAPGDVLVEIGETASGISQVAAGVGADLLVIGRHSEGLPRHPYAILRASPCPVATI